MLEGALCWRHGRYEIENCMEYLDFDLSGDQ